MGEASPSGQPSILVLGAGALGQAYAAHWTAAGARVVLLARGATLARVRLQGVTLQCGPEPPRRYLVDVADAAGDPACFPDYLVITIKSHDLDAAAPDILRWMGATTCVVPVVNGIPWWMARQFGLSDRLSIGASLAGHVAPEAVIGSVAVTPIQPLAAPLQGWSHGGSRILHVGSPHPGLHGKANDFASAVHSAGLAVTVHPRIVEAVWDKLVGNVGINLVTFLADVPVGSLLEDPSLRERAANVMEEVRSIAFAAGCREVASTRQRMELIGRSPTFITSTLQDRRAGRRVELDSLGWAVLQVADALHVHTPHLARLVHQCAVLAKSEGVA